MHPWVDITKKNQHFLGSMNEYVISTKFDQNSPSGEKQ